MKGFVSNKIGRMFFIRLEEGDYVLESITEFVKENNIKNAAVVSAFGTLSRGVTHYITTTGYPSAFNLEILEDRPIELSSLEGLIVDGVPHLHTVISDTERVYAGHCEPGCKVLYAFEAAIIEAEGMEITRKLNEKGKPQIEYK